MESASQHLNAWQIQIVDLDLNAKSQNALTNVAINARH